MIELLYPKSEATFFDQDSPPNVQEVIEGQLQALRNLGSWLLGTQQEQPPLATLLMMTDDEVRTAIQDAVTQRVADHPYFTALLFLLAWLIRKYRVQEEKLSKLALLRDRLQKQIASLGKEKMDSAKELAIVRAQLEAVFAIQGQAPPAPPAAAPSPAPLASS